jgi:cbb3-type cytochrome oxidase maturation protein
MPKSTRLASNGFLVLLWILKSGQYDDMEGAALRMLSDDEVAE